MAIAIKRWRELRRTSQYWQSQALIVVTSRSSGPYQWHFREFPNMLPLIRRMQLVMRYEVESTRDSLMLAPLLASTARFGLSSAS